LSLGVEVKSGEPLEVQCGDAFILHLSQASLGDCKKDKGNGSVCLYVKVDDKKLVLGTLSSEKIPQLQLDLVFDRDFQLSHNGKNGSVYFIGAPFSHASEIKPAKEEKEKPSSSGTKKVKIVEPIKDDSSDEESDDSSDEDDDLSDDDDQTDNGDDDDDDDEDEDSDEEETDEEDVIEKKKDSTSKKRSDPETTTPVPNKKAKMVTPQKTGVKKASEHKATPHPAKQATKTSASGDPKLHVCKSCNRFIPLDRSFGTDFALESHSKAKHGDGK
ncbi:Histone deacetylase HDT1, partial [Linum perenne]